MSPESFRDPYLAGLAARIAVVRARTRQLASDSSPDRMTRRPANGGWSAAEVFEHMCIANLSYEKAVDRAIERSCARRDAPRAFRSTLGGGFLIRALEPGSRNVPTLRPFQPLAVRPNVADAFLASMDWVEGRMRAADGLDLRVMLTSPVMPILRLNLGEAFEVAVVHSERHLNQIERALKEAAAS